MINRGRSCSRYRPLLEDFVDRGEIQPGTGAALAHLERCGRCLGAIEGTVLTITALRRMGDDLGSIEPAADAWPRLRDRITSLRRPAVMSPLAGIAMSIAIVAVLILPAGLTSDSLWAPSATANPEPVSDLRVEGAYLASRRAVAQGPVNLSPATSGSLPRLRTEAGEFRKEVKPATPLPRLI